MSEKTALTTEQIEKIAGGDCSVEQAVTLINNLTAAPLDFHFFQYSDFDLGGVAGGQTIQLGKDLSDTRFNEAYQTGPGAILDESITVAAPGANHREAGLFNATLVRSNKWGSG